VKKQEKSMAKPFTEDLKQQWKENILSQRQSKLSIASWCRQNNIASHLFYYWQSRLFPKPVINCPTFLEAVGENDSSTGITLECQGVTLCIKEHFNPSTLKKCLEVLKAC
jgi:hypothetical protein